MGEVRRNKKSRIDAIVLLLAILGFFCSLGGFVFSGVDQDDSTIAAVGRVVWMNNDIRRKSASQLAWSPMRVKQGLGLGDSIFTGEKSGSRIDLVSGGSIDLGENTLITFTTIDGIRLPDLAGGNFRLRVNGPMRVAVGGRVFDLDGNGGEVQVYVSPEGRPVFRSLTPGVALQLRSGGRRLSLGHEPSEAFAQDAEEHRIRAMEPDTKIAVTARFDDFYQGDGIEWRKRTAPPERSAVPTKLSWSARPEGTLVELQVARDPSFAERLAEAQTTDGSFVVPNAFFGDTYWRLSTDGKSWSPSYRVHVVRESWAAPPEMFSERTSLELFAGAARTDVFFRMDPGAAFVVVEAAASPDFRADATQVTILKAGEPLALTFDRPGDFFYRARVMDAERKISDPSKTVMVSVRRPAPPVLAKERPVPRREVAMAPTPTPAETAVAKAPVDAPVVLSAALPPPPPESSLNLQYRDSMLQVEGAGLSMYSRAEIKAGNEVKSALSLGLRALAWSGAHGVEGSVKSAVVSPEDGGSTTSPLSLEFRYRWRHLFGFNPFPGPDESEISGIAGIESYRNHGSAKMSPGYDLLKVGLGTEFPLWKRFDTGGEILYGTGADGSRKYEISGHLHYHLRPGWSAGAGYRVNLFEAGGDRTSPAGVPYREGYGEGYSVLRWHY